MIENRDILDDIEKILFKDLNGDSIETAYSVRQLETGQQIHGDIDEGEDEINIGGIAEVLAVYLAYSNLEPPFVLGGNG